MRRYAVVTLALLALFAGPARAQEELLDRCAGLAPSATPPGVDVTEQFRVLCAQVVNAVANVQPGVGIAFSGGNPVLGTATTLGTRLSLLPRVSVTARANVAFTKLPDLFDYGAQLTGSTATGSTLPAVATFGTPIASVQGDVSVGMFNGLSFGPMVGGVGAVDLLGSVAFIPRVEDFGLTEAVVNGGIGARIGILKQGLVVPGISVSAMYRRMGEVGFGDLAAGDPAEFEVDLSTLSVRGIVSKGIALVDLAVGAGYDRYSSDVALGWSLECATADCTAVNGGDPIPFDGMVAGELSTAAWNVFGNVGLSLLVFNLVGEIGYQKATDIVTLEELQNRGITGESLTDEELGGGRLFGSIGLRVAL